MILQTVECILCGEKPICYTGHVHSADGVKATAGWCGEHRTMRELGGSTIIPMIAEMFPARVEIQKELTKASHPDCQGCYGDYDGSIEEWRYPPRPKDMTENFEQSWSRDIKEPGAK